MWKSCWAQERLFKNSIRKWFSKWVAEVHSSVHLAVENQLLRGVCTDFYKIYPLNQNWSQRVPRLDFAAFSVHLLIIEVQGLF